MVSPCRFFSVIPLSGRHYIFSFFSCIFFLFFSLKNGFCSRRVLCLEAADALKVMKWRCRLIWMWGGGVTRGRFWHLLGLHMLGRGSIRRWRGVKGSSGWTTTPWCRWMGLWGKPVRLGFWVSLRTGSAGIVEVDETLFTRRKANMGRVQATVFWFAVLLFCLVYFFLFSSPESRGPCHVKHLTATVNG